MCDLADFTRAELFTILAGESIPLDYRRHHNYIYKDNQDG